MWNLGRNEKDKNIRGNSNCSTSSLPETDAVSFDTSEEIRKGDILDEIQKDDIVSCSKHGVMFVNLPGMFKLVYSGELAKNGAEQISAVIGHGSGESLADAPRYPMNKTSERTFELLDFKKEQGDINVAFVDNAGNWDNNGGQNYIFYNNTL